MILRLSWPIFSEVNSSDPCTSTTEVTKHKHNSLKNTVPTRWNSTLEMIESILDLQKPVDSVLKKIGKFDLCLCDDDIDLLKQLCAFLLLFRDSCGKYHSRSL